MKTGLTRKQLEDIGGTLWMNKRRWWLLAWLVVSMFTLIPFMAATPDCWWRWFVLAPLLSIVGAFCYMFLGLNKARSTYANKHQGWVEDV